MNEEEKELLKIIAKKVEQNSEILKGMRSAERWNKFLKLIYWVVVIIVGLYIWQLMQPVLDSLLKAKESIGMSFSSLSEMINQLTDIVEKNKLIK